MFEIVDIFRLGIRNCCNRFGWKKSHLVQPKRDRCFNIRTTAKRTEDKFRRFLRREVIKTCPTRAVVRKFLSFVDNQTVYTEKIAILSLLKI